MPERMIPSPWKEFLGEIDSLLKEPLDLRCIGGFAFTYFYGLERGTSDLDYFSALPADLLLIDFAGEGVCVAQETQGLLAQGRSIGASRGLRKQIDGDGARAIQEHSDLNSGSV